MFFFIFLTYLLDIVLILLGEILSWSLMGVRGLTRVSVKFDFNYENLKRNPFSFFLVYNLMMRWSKRNRENYSKKGS